MKAYSSKLLNEEMIKIIIDGRDRKTVNTCMDNAFTKIQDSDEFSSFGLIITGDALVFAMEPQFSKKIVELADNCNVVIGCRVSPKQKQEVDDLFRKEVSAYFTKKKKKNKKNKTDDLLE